MVNISIKKILWWTLVWELTKKTLETGIGDKWPTTASESDILFEFIHLFFLSKTTETKNW